MYGKITSILASFNLGNDLLVLTDEQVDNISRMAGIDVDNPIYKADQKLVTPIKPAAQCVKGVLGDYIRDNYEIVVPDIMKKWMDKRQYEFILSFIYGRIVIYIDECVRQFSNYSEALISKMMLNLVGHELRHSVQGLEMLDLQTNDLSDPIKYALQRHELDAYAFGQALVMGMTTLEEVSTWKPSQEFLNLVAETLKSSLAKYQAA